jgi:hypothetical protein
VKEKELREHAICSVCHKPIGHAGLPCFWTLKIERHGILMGAVRRQDGLTALLGGSAILSQVMGPDEEMTQPLMDPLELTVCENCATGKAVYVAALAETPD